MPVASSPTKTPGAGRYSLRPFGQQGDADLVFQWRNDPVTRDASFDTAEKSRTDMERSLETWCREDPLPPHLLDYENTPVAFVRISRPRKDSLASASSVEISIHVAPDARRRCGHAKAALQLADDAIQRAGHNQIVALVKEENAISRRLFEGRGYRRTGEVEIPGSEDVSVLVYLCDFA